MSGSTNLTLAILATTSEAFSGGSNPINRLLRAAGRCTAIREISSGASLASILTIRPKFSALTLKTTPSGGASPACSGGLSPSAGLCSNAGAPSSSTADPMPPPISMLIFCGCAEPAMLLTAPAIFKNPIPTMIIPTIAMIDIIPYFTSIFIVSGVYQIGAKRARVTIISSPRAASMAKRPLTTSLTFCASAAAISSFSTKDTIRRFTMATGKTTSRCIFPPSAGGIGFSLDNTGKPGKSSGEAAPPSALLILAHLYGRFSPAPFAPTDDTLSRTEKSIVACTATLALPGPSRLISTSSAFCSRDFS